MRLISCRGLLPIFAAGVALGCAAVANPPATPGAMEKTRTEVLQTYARIASAVYSDSHAKAEEMRTKIFAFLDHPSAEGLTAAREAWIAARIPYLQTEAFRFAEGPIDQAEPRINAWPIDENYIDYVAEDPKAGVINQTETFPTIDQGVLLSLNQKDGEKNISTGFHAIEFLLWGQDLSADGPGTRSYRDYLSGPEATAPNAERRKTYVRLVTDLLIEDLHTVAAAWADGDPAAYRAWFLALPPEQAISKVLHGIGTFGGVELAGERLTVAYETKEQEDEHSCFSDTTHLDVRYDARGIQNIYRGNYTRLDGSRVEGSGLHRLFTVVDAPLAGELARQVDAAVTAADAIPAPFDRAVQGTDASAGRLAIQKTIQALQAQSDPFAKAFGLVGLRPGRISSQE